MTQEERVKHAHELIKTAKSLEKSLAELEKKPTPEKLAEVMGKFNQACVDLLLYHNEEIQELQKSVDRLEFQVKILQAQHPKYAKKQSGRKGKKQEKVDPAVKYV